MEAEQERIPIEHKGERSYKVVKDEEEIQGTGWKEKSESSLY